MSAVYRRAGEPVLAPLRVMICDDVPELRELLRHCFLREPTTTLIAAAVDGHEALAWAAETHPDVIVTDLSMPGPSPADLVAGLHASAPDAAIVLYSGSSGATLGRQRGKIRLEVPKGVSPRQLVERVRDLGPLLRDATPER